MKYRVVDGAAVETMKRLRREGTLFRELTCRERYYVERRFGLCGEAPKTYREVGAHSNQRLSGERVRQIVEGALAKLGVDPYDAAD